MDYSRQLALSYYKTIATLNEEHNIFLVQHQDTQEIFVKKILSVYNAEIYKTLSECPVRGTPQIVDYFEENQQLTLIETYISGQSLEQIVRNSVPDLATVIHYTVELCEILRQLHSMQPPIIHRDIKPSNIIITEYNHVILLDFNAAKQYSNSSCDTVLLGTQGYAAPEQYGFGSSSPQTDIYAIGILLKELTAPLADIPSDITKIIKKCTKLKPSERYRTVEDLKIALEHSIQEENKEAKQPFSYKQLLLPGFRTGTAWKMLLATPVYLLILWISVSLSVENTYGAELWIQRFFFLLMLLSVIFATFNYMNMQSILPLCKSRHRIIRYLGIILLDALLVLVLILLMVTTLLFLFH